MQQTVAVRFYASHWRALNIASAATSAGRQPTGAKIESPVRLINSNHSRLAEFLEEDDCESDPMLLARTMLRESLGNSDCGNFQNVQGAELRSRVAKQPVKWEFQVGCNWPRAPLL
jgi:hypothetical protein